MSLAHLEENIVVDKGKVDMPHRTAHDSVAADYGSLAESKIKKEYALTDTCINGFDTEHIYSQHRQTLVLL